MPKNIVICCDGTGNEVGTNLSNVLKLFRIVEKNASQVVFYDPGVGTLSSSDPWSQLKAKWYLVLGLTTGYGLDANILDAYNFLVERYEPGDKVFLFGFSRGAYTVRTLAGFLRLVGLVQSPQSNLADYALTAYKQAATKNDLKIGGRFERIIATRRVPIHFVGVWDTVSSVIVPRPDRFYLPSLQELPFTKKNQYVNVFRHALALDERRRMFRLNAWTEPQDFKPNPFADAIGAQDIKQVWFAGVHSDVGGGYPEGESGAAKFPLRWMINEAVAHGLEVRKSMFDHLVLGKTLPGGEKTYTPPSATAKTHDSLNPGWWTLEWLPKRTKRREWPARTSFLGWYVPRAEPRPVPDGALVHHSVFERIEATSNDGRPYKPINLPQNTVEVGDSNDPGEGARSADAIA